MSSGKFPAWKAQKVVAFLRRELNYERHRQTGSHQTLVAEGRPTLTFAYHNGDTVPPGVLRDILVKGVGLSLQEALELTSGK